jgi:phenylacetate-CoA ligase
MPLHFRLVPDIIHLSRIIRQPRERQVTHRDRNFRKFIRQVHKSNPFWRDRLDRHKIAVNDLKTADDLKHFPILTKEEFLAAGEDFYTPGRKVVEVTSTSGTSGRFGEIRLDEEAVKVVRSLVTYNTLLRGQWHLRRLSGRPRILTIMVSGESTQKLMEYTPSFLANIRYVDIATPMEVVIAEIQSFRPHVIHAYPSILLALANELKRRKIELDLPLIAISAFAEMLDENLAAYLSRIYNAPVNNFYSSVETVLLSKSCPHGKLHFTLPTLIYPEILDPQTKEPAKEGELYVTNLFNVCTPIIRYSLGDWVQIDNAYCGCDWTTPMITKLHGRTSTVLEFPDGRLVSASAFFRLPRKIPQVLQYQIVQHSLTDVECRVILENPADSSVLKEPIRRVCDKIINNPEMKVRVTPVESLTTLGPGQKAPAVIPLSKKESPDDR